MGLPDSNFRSPLEAISFDRFKGRTTLHEEVITVGTSRVILLENNPNRLSWHMINESANDVRISTDPTITSSSGWLLAALGGIVEMLYYDDGEACGYQVFGISSVAGSNVRVREIVRL